jgi:hypothetical protein
MFWYYCNKFDAKPLLCVVLLMNFDDLLFIVFADIGLDLELPERTDFFDNELLSE